MHKFGVAGAAVAALCFLAGCQTPEIPYDRSGDVKTIGVLTPQMDKTPSVILASSVGQSFGLIGAAVDGMMEDNRETKFSGILDSRHYDPESKFAQYLVDDLTAKGYRVVQVPVSRDSSGLLKTYPAPNGEPVDAYLDVAQAGHGYGYIAAGISSSNPYRPFAWMQCKLVRTANSAVLMQDIVLYNPLDQPEHTVTIAPDPAYEFVDFDTLTAAPDRAVEGLDVSLKSTASSIAALLR